MCYSSLQFGNGAAAASSAVESATAAGSVDVSAATHHDSMAEVARQVFICLDGSTFGS